MTGSHNYLLPGTWGTSQGPLLDPLQFGSLAKRLLGNAVTTNVSKDLNSSLYLLLDHYLLDWKEN